MDNKAKSLISQFYKEEEERSVYEKSFARLEVSLKSSDIAMLQVISKRFGQNSDALAREALSGAIYNMFEALESKERKALAKDADETTEVNDGEEASVVWTMNDRSVTREENRLKKLAKAEEEKLVKTNKDSAETSPAPQEKIEDKAEPEIDTSAPEAQSEQKSDNAEIEGENKMESMFL